MGVESSAAAPTIWVMAGSLVIYAGTPRGDAVLRDEARHDEPLTVVSLAREEPVGLGCCDTRSVYWNGVQRDMAETDLARARLTAEDAPMSVLRVPVLRVVETILRGAAAIGADRIVLADARASGLGRRAVRRLRRRSRVPVVG